MGSECTRYHDARCVVVTAIASNASRCWFQSVPDAKTDYVANQNKLQSCQLNTLKAVVLSRLPFLYTVRLTNTDRVLCGKNNIKVDLILTVLQTNKN